MKLKYKSLLRTGYFRVPKWRFSGRVLSLDAVSISTEEPVDPYVEYVCGIRGCNRIGRMTLSAFNAELRANPELGEFTGEPKFEPFAAVLHRDATGPSRDSTLWLTDVELTVTVETRAWEALRLKLGSELRRHRVLIIAAIAFLLGAAAHALLARQADRQLQRCMSELAAYRGSKR